MLDIAEVFQYENNSQIMMDLHKPLKKSYEKKCGKITEKMVDELIEIAKNDYDFKYYEFVNEYLK